MKGFDIDKYEPITDAEHVKYNRQDYCGFWRRFAANFLDGAILGMAYKSVDVVLLALASLTGTSYLGFSDWMLSTIIFWAYMLWFKSYRGATPGYNVFGIRIISIKGSQVSIKQIVVRTVSSFLSAIPLGLGYLWIAIDPDRQAWHDKIAGTYVIKAESRPVQTNQQPSPGPVRIKLLTSLIIVCLLMLLSLIAGVVYLLKDSDAYKLSKQYIGANMWVQQEVGNTIEFGIIESSKVFNGASGKANLIIRVSGEKGEVTVTTRLEKRDGEWQIIKAGYFDSDNNYIDITMPYTGSKVLEVRKSSISIRFVHMYCSTYAPS
ncbi:hypothetical protein SCALIN_C28_0117 [Candidatus Scalindua japonica]|uniref:RDD domain-containing protein n=1 Tax=Candidatus Scalindua japonica TaxID=1284222 RepID=A0A286U1C1_9BACT|nr:cytochrome c oxidase assembly factor Coa1 family protein [Candidatus Scalindua japonica]GAX61915.1 hypothetical protein SCALIN_C28_0117 [Candidatus Scalindua japonica]